MFINEVAGSSSPITFPARPRATLEPGDRYEKPAGILGLRRRYAVSFNDWVVLQG